MIFVYITIELCSYTPEVRLWPAKQPNMILKNDSLYFTSSSPKEFNIRPSICQANLLSFHEAFFIIALKSKLFGLLLAY